MAQKRYEENLSPYAELFRSKLIEDFHLLESFDEHGKSDAPKYYSKDFEGTVALSVYILLLYIYSNCYSIYVLDLLDPARQDKMMLENPHGLVKFQVYSRKEPGEVSPSDRRRNRVKNKNSKNPPLDIWAHYVLENILSQYSF